MRNVHRFRHPDRIIMQKEFSFPQAHGLPMMYSTSTESNSSGTMNPEQTATFISCQGCHRAGAVVRLSCAHALCETCFQNGGNGHRCSLCVRFQSEMEERIAAEGSRIGMSNRSFVDVVGGYDNVVMEKTNIGGRSAFLSHLTEKIHQCDAFHGQVSVRRSHVTQAQVEARQQLERYGLEESYCCQMENMIINTKRRLEEVRRIVYDVGQKQSDENDSAAVKLPEDAFTKVNSLMAYLEQEYSVRMRQPLPRFFTPPADCYVQQMAYVGGFHTPPASSGQSQLMHRAPVPMNGQPVVGSPPVLHGSPYPSSNSLHCRLPHNRGYVCAYNAAGGARSTPGPQSSNRAYVYAYNTAAAAHSTPVPQYQQLRTPMPYVSPVAPSPACAYQSQESITSITCQAPNTTRVASFGQNIGMNVRSPVTNGLYPTSASATNMATAQTPPAKCSPPGVFSSAGYEAFDDHRSSVQTVLEEAMMPISTDESSQVSVRSYTRRRRLAVGGPIKPSGQRRKTSGKAKRRYRKKSVSATVDAVVEFVANNNDMQPSLEDSNPTVTTPIPILERYRLAPSVDVSEGVPASDFVRTTMSPQDPMETRLVIDENVLDMESTIINDYIDSGVQSAITVEENSMAQVQNGAVKSEILDSGAAFVLDSRAAFVLDSGAAFVSTSGSSATSNEISIMDTSPDSWDKLCSVCNSDDGQSVIRCSNEVCGRAYHYDHHIPAYKHVPERDHSQQWLCTLCTDNVSSNYRTTGLNDYDQAACERILLSLYIHEDTGLFHYPVDPSQTEYYAVISKPMDFSVIRDRLSKRSYSDVEHFLADLNQVFENCYFYNNKVSSIELESMLESISSKQLDDIVDYYCQLVGKHCHSLADRIRKHFAAIRDQEEKGPTEVEERKSEPDERRNGEVNRE